MNWMRDVWSWLRGFPQPWRRVVISGDVLSRGGTLNIGPGITLEIAGSLTLDKSCQVYAVAIDGRSNCEINGGLAAL